MILLSCVQEVRDESTSIMAPGIEHGGLSEKMERLGKFDRIVVRGLMVLKTPSGAREGDYALSIEGNEMTMDIFAKGLKVGEITVHDNVATVKPTLNDEYLEYMFAVIIRDSIVWWKIYEYDLLTYQDFHVLRNSWKKVYVKTDMLTPSRQIFRLMKFRSVEVIYSDDRLFGNELLPSKITFNYRNYNCRITIEDMEF